MRNYNRDIAYAQIDCPDFLKGSYQADPQEIAYIASNPMEWLKSKQKSQKKYDGYVYLVTFGQNANSKKDMQKWLERIHHEINRAYVINAHCVVEYKEGNIHSHCIIESTKQLKLTDFKVFHEKFGYMAKNKNLIRIRIDNGVMEYISKTLGLEVIPSTKTDFLEYYLNEFKELGYIK